jgi:hypothetical protein
MPAPEIKITENIIKKIMKDYDQQGKPGVTSFISHFDAGLMTYLKEELSKKNTDSETIGDFFENMRGDPYKLIESTNEEIIKAALGVKGTKAAAEKANKIQGVEVIKKTNEITKINNMAEFVVEQAKTVENKQPGILGILGITLKQFLVEALSYNGRLFSAMEQGDRISLTKLKGGKGWNPAESELLITNNYLTDLEGFPPGKLSPQNDYNTKKYKEFQGINLEFKGEEIEDRTLYGFTGTIGNPVSEAKIHFCRRLGVVIYDLIMAKIGKDVINNLTEEKKEDIEYLFANFVKVRTSKMNEQITAFLGTEPKVPSETKPVVSSETKPVVPIKIVLLQEVGNAIFDLHKDKVDFTITDSQKNKITTRNAGSMILSTQPLKLEQDRTDDLYSSNSYELENSKLDGIQLFSFHGDTKGLETTPTIEKILTDPQYKDDALIIGLDSNLKTPELLFKFMEMCYKNGAKIAGFNLEYFKNNEYKKGTDFDQFYKNLQKVATNGGIRSGCQSQWTKIHDPTHDYIDFIVYKGTNLTQVPDPDGKSTSITPLSITAEVIEETALVNAGVVDKNVYKNGSDDGWGAKVLSETNPSDHLPRCSTFQLGTNKFSVLSWNVAGPNFNWAEYYGSDNINDIKQGMIDVFLKKKKLSEHETEIKKIIKDQMKQLLQQKVDSGIATASEIIKLSALEGGRRRTKKQQSRKKRKRQGKRSKKQKRTKTRRN